MVKPLVVPFETGRFAVTHKFPGSATFTPPPVYVQISLYRTSQVFEAFTVPNQKTPEPMFVIAKVEAVIEETPLTYTVNELPVPETLVRTLITEIRYQTPVVRVAPFEPI